MSKYLPINLSFFKEHPNQWRALVYRLYINFFGIFLGIKLLPMGISFKDIDFWYKNDDIFWNFKKRKWFSFGCEGEFRTLKEMDEFWENYAKEA